LKNSGCTPIPGRAGWDFRKRQGTDKTEIADFKHQISNNIQIRKFNDPKVLMTYFLFDSQFAGLGFLFLVIGICLGIAFW
jgi:hypothetical protein